MVYTIHISIKEICYNYDSLCAKSDKRIQAFTSLRFALSDYIIKTNWKLNICRQPYNKKIIDIDKIYYLETF